eukprot:11471736-Alexandrium_andersonii.AAC.1
MSASLVGSEMCIRDSSPGWRLERPPWTLRLAHPARRRHQSGGSWGLSLIHILTLPTICSV